MARVKVLYLVSNPAEQDRLALHEESRTITAMIRASEHRDALELIPAWAVRPGDLQQLLLQHKPHVVHYSGHGTRGGPAGNTSPGAPSPRRDMVARDIAPVDQLMLMGDGGYAQPVSKAALVDLFTVLKDNVHLVLLSACHSESIAESLAEVVPCTIGMSGSVSDEAAIAFAAAFYQALGFGRDIRQAFELGKIALMNLRAPAGQIPRLFTRKGASDPSNIVLAGPSLGRYPGNAQAPSFGAEHPPDSIGDPGNLLHVMWDYLDENLQDAFSLAYDKKRRQGGNRISTKDFFQALVRLEDESVKTLIHSMPAQALPDPIDAAVPKESRLVLEESPLLSDCVADSLEHFRGLTTLPRKISSVDMFVDIAKHGHGESVSRLRQHGVGKKEIEERVSKLGLPVLRRNAD